MSKYCEMCSACKRKYYCEDAKIATNVVLCRNFVEKEKTEQLNFTRRELAILINSLALYGDKNGEYCTQAKAEGNSQAAAKYKHEKTEAYELYDKIQKHIGISD